MRQNKIPPEHVALVERTARSVARKLGAWLGSQEYGDLVQAGLMCYGGVVERHDPEKGSFEHYLGLRSRGAMLDYLRSSDLVSQRERRKIRDMERVRLVLTNELRREPTVAELAERVGLSVREVQELSNAPLLCNLEHPAIFGTLSVQPPDFAEESISETIDRVVQGTSLTERQSKTLQMVREGKTQKEIAAVFGVTEPAISQIMTKVISVLQRTARRQKLVNGGQKEMGSNRHTRPTGAANAFALKQVVKHLWARDSFNLGDVQSLNLAADLTRFDAGAWVQSAKAADHVRIVGVNTRLFRLNRNSRPVVEAAMEAGYLAGKAMAEKQAFELITQDGAEFVAFCEALAEVHPDGQFFTAGDVHEIVCTLLNLDPKVWARASISHLLVAISRQMPMRIRHESKGVSGYHFKITLPPPKVSEEKVSKEVVPDIVAPPEPPLVEAEEALVKQDEVPSTDVQPFKLDLEVTLPSRDGQWREDLCKDRMVQIFFLSFIGAAGPDGWKRTMAIRVALMQQEGWEDVGRDTTASILNYLEKEGWVVKQGQNKGREYQLTDKGRQRLALLTATKISVPAQPVDLAPEVIDLESLTQASGPVVEPETTVIENVEPNEPGSPALTSEDEGLDREELPAPPEEITLSFTPPTHTRAELEEKIRQVQARAQQDREERERIAEQIRELQARDLELSQMAPLREQEIVHLEQELTNLEHAVRAATEWVDALLGSVDPLKRKILKAKLLEQG